MVKRTPQEKKELSYAKDRRNNYGENDKASRKNVPLQKAKSHRSYRKKATEAVHAIVNAGDEEQREIAESDVLSVKKPDWKKYPDEPLGEIVKQQLEWRESHAGNGKTAQKKIREFEENLKIEVEQQTDGRWIAKALDMDGVLVYGKTQDEAVKTCRRLAHGVFVESIGAGKLTISGDFISVSAF